MSVHGNTEDVSSPCQVETIRKDLIDGSSGVLVAVYALDPSVERGFPLFILNPHYPEANQAIFRRFFAEFEALAILHHSYTSPIPAVFLENYVLPRIETKETGLELPHSIPHAELIVCTAEEVGGIVLPTYNTRLRTFRILPKSLPTAKFQHNSWVSIIYNRNDRAIVIPAHPIRSTKGFVDDDHFEIIELKAMPYGHTAPTETHLLLVPSPLIHADVPISVERNSFNRATIDAISSIGLEEDGLGGKADLAPEGQEDRIALAMQILQRQTIAYRDQCI